MKQRACCFILIVVLLPCDYNCLCLFPTVLFVGLQCAIMKFPGHTHLYFEYCKFTSLELEALCALA